ncbi:MAG: BON domain-containing protein [Pirellulaceae bacterium]
MRRLFLGLAIASIAALSPCWVHADDQQIAQQIVQQLRQQKADGRLTGFGIDLEVESGIVWLKGHVTTPEQQQMVLEIARRVEGVEQVVNDLRVKDAAVATAEQPARSASNSGAKDSTVMQKPGQLLTNLNRNVQRAFRPEKEALRAAQPQAEPKDSRQQVVQAKLAQPKLAQPTLAQPTLAQPTLAQPTLAQPTLAQPRLTPPVPAQPSEVAPIPAQTTTVAQTRPSAPSDDELAEDIIGRLRTQKERGTLRNFDVDVQVNNRVVWVSGRTASDEQQSLVLDIARRVRGVKQVVNDLQVASQAPVQVVSAPVLTADPVMAPPSQAPAPVGTPVGLGQVPAPFPYAPNQAARQVPLAFAPAQSVAYSQPMMGQPMAEVPAAAGVARARFDNPAMPGYAWPSYAAYPNYAAVTYPRQYSPTAWPYIGPFYPYPQVPLGWRKVTMEWDDGWWWLDFKSK